MTWPDPRWHDRCTNCGHQRCDHHDYKGDPCHTCSLDGNPLGGPACQRFEEKAKLNPGAWDDYQEALQYAYFCRCGKISVGPEGAPTRCSNCVTLTVYRATLPEEWRHFEAAHVCTWVPHAKTLLKSCCGNYRRIEPLARKQIRLPGFQAHVTCGALVGVTALFKIIWWITKNSAIGTAYGYQVWWWILTGRGSPPMLTMDGSDLSKASAPAGQLSPTEVRY